MCCSSLCPFDGLCFDHLGALLITDPFLKRKPLLEERPEEDEELQSVSRWKLTSSLGFVARHFSGEQPIEEVSENEGGEVRNWSGMRNPGRT